jgi:hypothetical protein
MVMKDEEDITGEEGIGGGIWHEDQRSDHPLRF